MLNNINVYKYEKINSKTNAHSLKDSFNDSSVQKPTQIRVKKKLQEEIAEMQ